MAPREGEEAGRNSNVAVSSVLNERARRHIELWMTGPFHAIGVLRPNLNTVGFGKCDNASTTPFRSGATLDVLHGLGAPVQLALVNVTVSGPGFVTGGPNNRISCAAGNPLAAGCQGMFKRGTTVTFTAHPKQGHRFGRWGTGACRKQIKCQVHLKNSALVIAAFRH